MINRAPTIIWSSPATRGDRWFTNLDVKPSFFSKTIKGGPLEAEVEIFGPFLRLKTLPNLLGLEAVFQSHRGDELWRGYVESVELRSGHSVYTQSLNSMFNYVSVRYTDELETNILSGAGNADSMTFYGTKTLFKNLTNINDSTAATEWRTKYLADHAFPYHAQQWDSSYTGPNKVTVRFKGWFETLDWLLYANNTDSQVDTGTQITTIFAACNQFMNSTLRETLTSSITTQTLRDNSLGGAVLIKELMEIGVSGGNRYMADVNGATRKLHVFEEPSISNKVYRLKLSREFEDSARSEVAPWLCPVGVWVKDDRIPPGHMLQNSNLNQGLFFIEHAEYDFSSNILYATPRGAQEPLDIGGGVNYGF